MRKPHLLMVTTLLLAFSLAGPASAAESRNEPPYAGRSVLEILEELRSGGLKLVFSSDLVTPDLIVKDEPKSKSPRKLLAEVLAPHRLRVIKGPGETVLIVRAATDSAPAVSSIRGTVLDADQGTPLPGARVEVVETGIEVQTDSGGRFEVATVEIGTYTLKVRLPGYVVQRLDNVRVVSGRPAEVIFKLQVSPELIEAIDVEPSHYLLYGGEPQTRQSLSREEIEQIPNIGDDAHRVAARLPGVANPDMSAKLFVRGGGDDEVLVLLDGLELYAPFHFEPHSSLFSIVNSRAVGSADLSTGGFSAMYGDRMSGVLDISTVGPSTKRRTTLGVSFLNAHLISEGLFGDGRGEWLLAARRGYMDLVLDIVGDENTSVTPRYGDLLGKARYRLGNRTTLSANVLYAANDFDLLDEDPWAHLSIVGSQKNTYGWVTLESAWNPKLYSRTLAYVGRMDREGYGEDFEESRHDSSVEDHRKVGIAGLKQDWSLQASKSHFLQAGFDAKRLKADYDYYSFSEVSNPIFLPGELPVVTEREEQFQESGWQYAAYISDRIMLSEALTAEIGLRWDRQSYTGDDGQVSPRMNLLYRPTERNEFRAAWGLFFQSQGIHDIQVEDGINTFHEAQQTRSIVVGYARRFRGGLSVGIEAYSKQISSPWPRFENLFHPSDGLPEAKPDRTRIDPEKGRAEGIELFARRRGGGRFQWWMGYVLSRAEDYVEGEWVARSWDQTHAVTFDFNYRIGQKWNFNASGLFHTGWPTTEVMAELVENPDGSFSIDPILGPRNEDRFGAYYRLDARASRNVQVRHGQLTFFLEVMNLFGAENPCCGDEFSYHVQPDGSVKVERHVQDWLPMLPSFGINWIF